MKTLVTTLTLAALAVAFLAATDPSGAAAGGSPGGKQLNPRQPDSVGGLAGVFDEDGDDAGTRPRRPRREDAEDEFRRRAPQIEFVCQPARFGYDEYDLVLECESPLILVDEVVAEFTVRGNNRFSSPAASLISAAVIAGQPLVLTVNEPANPHSRCSTGCRRINRAQMTAAPPA